MRYSKFKKTEQPRSSRFSRFKTTTKKENTFTSAPFETEFYNRNATNVPPAVTFYR